MVEDIDVLRTVFRANIEAIGLQPSQVIMWNEPPKDIDETKPWAIFSVTPGGAEEQGFDTHIRVLQTGYTMLQIFVPKGKGSKLAYEIAGAFRKLYFKFRQRSATGYILTKVGYPREVTNKDYLQVNVFVPYESVRMLTL